jgi:hypothetical protein
LPNNWRLIGQLSTADFGEIFAFTAVDIFSREADILLASELTSHWGYAF